jgi:hypothetical protein
MLVTEDDVSHSYSNAIPRGPVGRLGRNRHKKKAKWRGKISEPETANTEAQILLDLYKGNVRIGG